MTRIYVAGPSRELERCERVIAAVRDRGHMITHDWAAVMRAVGTPDSDLEDEMLRPYLADDLGGVHHAQSLLVLLPTRGHTSSGLFVELGYALRGRHEIGAPLIIASRGFVPMDPTRCVRCGWPLWESIEKGCTADNCSMRPLPPLPDPPGRANGWARCFADLLVETDDEAIEAVGR
jgi:hypothetical protein